jgi:8-oxo-dGTP pyrophosphatase MutT (NUDIX family)
MMGQLQRHRHLSELVEPGTARASSLLVVGEGRFLLAVRPPIIERDRVLLRLTGIGGWSEGDETFAATAVRESIEETGIAVRLIDLDQTLVVHSPDDINLLAVSGEVAPAALVYRRFGTAPFDPWSAVYRSVAPVAVFAGTLGERPRITAREEHPFFMWVYPEQMMQLSDADEPLEYLLADGAELAGPAEIDRERAIVRLTDSIQALITALGPRAYSFLSEIARLTQPASAE